MKFRYAGKYNNDPGSLPQRQVPGSVQFREFEDLQKFGFYMNLAALGVIIVLVVLVYLRSGTVDPMMYCIGGLLSMLILVPHEFIHALCFREEVLMYQNLSAGMLFVVGTESMSKTQFVLMSMMPNLVFGFLPYLIFMIFPQLTFLGVFGALAISMGAGDYMNVYNALTQVPKGGKIYMSGIHSFWYLPEKTEC